MTLPFAGLFSNLVAPPKEKPQGRPLHADVASAPSQRSSIVMPGFCGMDKLTTPNQRGEGHIVALLQSFSEKLSFKTERVMPKEELLLGQCEMSSSREMLRPPPPMASPASPWMAQSGCCVHPLCNMMRLTKVKSHV